MSDTGPLDGAVDRQDLLPSGAGHQGSPSTPQAPADGHQKPRRRSLAALAVLIALVLVASAIGFGIGYGVAGTPGSSPATGAAPTGTPGTGTATLDVTAITAAVAPSLVVLNTKLDYQTAQGAGTGMVVTSSGRVITNNHVIAGATTIQATDLGTGQTYSASVVGYDTAEDVAVLQLQGASHLATVTFAGSSAHLGQTVVAVGNAGGTGTATAAAGVVTGLDQTITARSELSGTTEHLNGLIETSAAIEAGDSGGPLVDTRGRVLGMVTAGSASYTFSQNASQGYAVPTTTFRTVADDIVQGDESGTVHVGATAFLGVRVTTAQVPGALVVQTVPGSPAAGAGIAAGDLIVAVGGQTVGSPDTLSSELGAFDPGATVQVTLVDPAGQSRTVTATLVAGPPA